MLFLLIFASDYTYHINNNDDLEQKDGVHVT